MNVAGMLVGLVTGLGLLVVASWWDARRPRSLAERIGPYLGGAGAWIPVHGVSRQGRRRPRRGSRSSRHLAEQLPVLADLTALAVTAGAGPLAALEAAASSLPGGLAAAVLSTCAQVRAGRPADSALRALADDVALPGLRRLVDALLIAVEHGTPLAAVARGQAEDLRSDRRRLLMESAGRRDIGMLVPIVFLVLPSVVVVALFPGLQSLQFVV